MVAKLLRWFEEFIGNSSRSAYIGAWVERWIPRKVVGRRKIMANEERRESQDLGQDPYVEKLRPDPSQPPEAVRILEGFLGESDREGYRRLYFTRELDYYMEFRAEDVVF